jgi:hypothetical protein
LYRVGINPQDIWLWPFRAWFLMIALAVLNAETGK